jgi:hypothetical protein
MEKPVIILESRWEIKGAQKAKSLKKPWSLLSG